MQASVRSIVSCDRTATFTQLGASAAAKEMGAKPQTAQTIGVVTDISIGIARHVCRWQLDPRSCGRFPIGAPDECG
jgi:hypothetical protein